MKMCYQVILACLFVIRLVVANVDDSWSFIVLADWHGAESFAVSPVNDTYATNIYYNDTLSVLRRMNETYGGDLVVLPGDSNNGKWHAKSFRDNLRDHLGLSNLSENEAIAVGGKNCYSTSKRLFSEAGYDQILLGIGDHELGGDGWSKDSSKLNGLPFFRDSLAREINQKDEVFIYTKPIGNATSRPIGTPYAKTSYAYLHKNVLFVTVDAFHNTGANYFDKEKGEGGTGVITCNVKGDHLLWFEDVLREARKDPAISHIIVQAHIPILQPVRKINSSGQFLDAGTQSEFWKVMQKYSVDVYFGGEVHSNTATKDPDSNLLQVISRGNRLNNFLKVDVSSDQLIISAYNEVGTKWIWNGNYTKFGEIKVDKSSDHTSIESSGALSLLDVSKGPLISLKFDSNDRYLLKDRQIVGLKYDQFQESLIGYSVTIRDEICVEGIENHGVFGRQYDAQIANIQINDGGLFNKQSRLAFGSMGPLAAGEIISTSLRFKTATWNESVLIFYGDKWGQVKKKNLFLLTLSDGNPIFYIDQNNFLTPTNKTMGLNDDNWHSIIVSMPRKSCLLSEVLIYIDDEPVETEVIGGDDYIFYTTSGHLSLGGWGYSDLIFGEDLFESVDNFEGKMDNFELWHSKVLKPQNPTQLPSSSPTQMPSSSPSSSPTSHQSTNPSLKHSQPPTITPLLGGSPTDSSSGYVRYNAMATRIICTFILIIAMQ